LLLGLGSGLDPIMLAALIRRRRAICKLLSVGQQVLAELVVASASRMAGTPTLSRSSVVENALDRRRGWKRGVSVVVPAAIRTEPKPEFRIVEPRFGHNHHRILAPRI